MPVRDYGMLRTIHDVADVNDVWCIFLLDPLQADAMAVCTACYILIVMVTCTCRMLTYPVVMVIYDILL